MSRLSSVGISALPAQAVAESQGRRGCQSKVDIHKNQEGALRLAASRGHTEVVKILVEAGADVRLLDPARTFHEEHEALEKNKLPTRPRS